MQLKIDESFAEKVIPANDSVRLLDIQPLCHITKYCVAAVQIAAVLMNDEKLGAGTVVVFGAGHGDSATSVGQLVLHAVGAEFPLDACAAAAGSIPIGVTSLDHEAIDNPVEGQSVVKALLCQENKIFNGLRGCRSIQRKGDSSIICYVYDGGVIAWLIRLCLL